jgi:pyridoxamine 5'-phosphate oxidase family protein
MSAFTDLELEYLGGGERRLARIATVGADGTPHVVPVGWTLDRDDDAIVVSGHDGMQATKKYRDVQATGRAAVVIDDLASVDPWRPRGIEIRGRAVATGATIRIHPERIVSWGIHSDRIGRRRARSVAEASRAGAAPVPPEQPPRPVPSHRRGRPGPPSRTPRAR